jgi:hypothetical protein
VLTEIQRLVAERKVRFTLKAVEELALLDLGLDEHDALEVLAALKLEDLAGRVESKRTREWLYVFKPEVAGAVLYLKLIVRAECVVVSFHHDEEDDED